MLSRSSRRATALESILCCFLSFLIALLAVPVNATFAIARGAESLQSPLTLAPTTQQSSPIREPIDFSFDEIKSTGSSTAPNLSVTTEALPQNRLQEILARLTPMAPDKEQKFILPEDSLVRPTLPGVRTQEVFPPTPLEIEKPSAVNTKPKVKVSPLTIRRVSPSGKIDNAEQLSVTFSQPMIAMSQVDEADAQQIVKLTPQPEGQWHWQDTQTITFDPKDKKFPKATDYIVRIGTDITSTSGSKLEKEAIHRFSTPPLGVERFAPTGKSEPLNPPIFLRFNQKLDKTQASKFIKLRSKTNEFALHVLSDAEIKASKVYGPNHTLYTAPQNLLLEAKEPLPINTAFKVTLEKGMPSLEGPLSTEVVQEFEFRTYGPLQLDGQRKEHYSTQNRNFTFTNPLDGKTVTQTCVRIEPAVEKFSIHFWGANQLSLQGEFKALTKYTVIFDKTIRDVFGQNLSGNPTISFIQDKVPFYLAADRQLSTFPRGQTPSCIFAAQETSELIVNVYQGLPSKFLTCQFAHFDGENIGLPILGQQKFAIGHDFKNIQVDLRKYLKNGCGQFYVVAKAVPKRGEHLYNPREQQPAVATWVQVTNIALDAFRGRQLVTLANSMADGAPLKDVNFTFSELEQKGRSDSNGIAKFKITNSDKQELLTAQRGDDISILPGNWNYHSPRHHKWCMVTDRNLYKPGETVNVKGWAREISFDEKEVLRVEKPKFETTEYTVQSSEGVEIGKGTAKVDASGGISFRIVLPAKVNLGSSTISIKPIDAVYSKLGAKPNKNAIETPATIYRYEGTSLDFQIQEFRRPEFEMTVDSSKGSSLFFDESTELTSNARYFSGGVLGKSLVKWTATAVPTAFTPPGRHEFTFANGHFKNPNIIHYISQTKLLEGTTDLQGNDKVEVKLKKQEYPFPISLGCEASVVDVNRQTWTKNIALLFHPADLYVGLRRYEYQTEQDKNPKVGVIVTDLDGKAKEGISVQLDLVKREDGVDKILQHLTVVSSSQPVQAEFEKQEKGIYIISATILDSHLRKNGASFDLTVIEKKEPRNPIAHMQKVSLYSDKEEYKPGEIAHLSVESPFFPAHGVINLRRNSGIVATIPVVLKSEKTRIAVPISPELLPCVTAEISLENAPIEFGTAQILLKVLRKEKILNLTVKALNEAAVPGETTTLNVDLKNSENGPVANGQVAIAVADESVLALTGYKWSDPVNAFYKQEFADIHSQFTRSTVVVSKEALTSKAGVKPAADLAVLPPRSALPPFALPRSNGLIPPPSPARDINMFQVEPTSIDERHYSTGRAERHQSVSPAQTIKIRTNFSALALFEPSVLTNKDGKAQIKFKLPDNVTRYRVMAIAAADTDKFGSSESSITTKLPLMVKPSAPRFLNFGDACELPVVIQNQTDKNLKVDVALRGQNISIGNVRENFKSLPTDESSMDKIPKSEFALGKIVDVPANDRVEVRFNITTINAGTAHFQCTAVAGNLVDSSEFSIPIYVPASKETFATYGQVDDGAIKQKLNFPTNVFEQVGGFSVSTSSTAMQALTDAYFYLYNYQYGCTEQISSRLIAMLSLQNILTAFGKLEGEAGTQFRTSVQKDLDALFTRQNDDGSFGLWSKNERTRWPFLTIQVAEAMRLAKEKDYRVDESVYSRCYQNIAHIENYFDTDYSEQCKLSLLAKALNVRYKSGDVDSAKAKKTIQNALARILRTFTKNEKNSSRKIEDIPSDILKQELPLDVAGWLLPVIAKDQSASKETAILRQQIDNEILETASTASTNSHGYGDWDYFLFYSPRRTDAIVLQALMSIEPSSPLIPKLVKGLLGHRKNGRWEGTQENGYILQTLDTYFNKYEKETPNFETQTWLDTTLVGLQTFKGRSTETKEVTVPTEYLLKNAPTEVLITKKGPGRLYYRLALDYARKELNIPAKARGFIVTRTYEFVDNKADVSKDKDGVWHFKSGAAVRVKINFEALGARYHVAMMDPIPAGAEPINSALQGSRQTNSNGNIVPFERARWRIWNWNWYEHQNLRDHQAEAFASVLWKGNHEFTYMIHATTPGIFRVPPTKVEEMYAEETFGRSSSEQVIIE